MHPGLLASAVEEDTLGTELAASGVLVQVLPIVSARQVMRISSGS